MHSRATRARGHDSLSVAEAGFAGASDESVRQAAIGSGRVLVTLDSDFGNIFRYPPEGTPGVIWLRLHPLTFRAIERALDRVLSRLDEVDLTNKLVVVDDDKIRIRGT